MKRRRSPRPRPDIRQDAGEAPVPNDSVPGERNGGFRLRVFLAVAIAVGGVLYVGNRWSPSSYSFVLQALGVEDTGLIAGSPRPDRGDEFGWQTPLFQMAIRNGFRRQDSTPPYFEDLRTIFGLPLIDWALVFKPALWGFFVLPPPVAYSLYQFFLLAMFLGGFVLVFEKQGGAPLESLLLGLVLFFTPYVQYWWNGFGNVVLPFFPWAVLAVTSKTRLSVKGVLLYWVCVSWLLSYFYPPVIIPLAFVAVIWMLAFWPEIFRGWTPVVLAGAALAAAGTAYVYLRAPLEALGRTVYPGHRVVGGGGIDAPRWASQFLPGLLFQNHVPLAMENVCELATIGSHYVLLVLCLLDYRRLFEKDGDARAARRPLLVLLMGLVLVWVWMVVYLPAWAGYPLLWHRVTPGRIVVAAGLLLFPLAFLAGRTCGFVFSTLRVALFSLTVCLGWYVAKYPRGFGFLETWRDWAIGGVLIVLAIWVRSHPSRRRRAHAGLLAASGLFGALTYGTYNPLQRTDQIFARHETEVTRQFDAQLTKGGNRFLVVPLGSSFFGHTGFPLVGLGYPSVGTATFAPKLEFWRKMFPELPEAEFQNLFNNAGMIAVQDVERPFRLQGTLVTVVPTAAFEKFSPGSPVETPNPGK